MKMIILFFITIIFILSCNSQKSVCRYNIDNEGTSMNDCQGAILLASMHDYDIWILQALTTCLTAIRKESDCNKKSEYIPAIGQGK